MNGGEAAAITESIAPNARHALGDGDGGEAAATPESFVSNTRQALGEGDGGESAATIESIASNARHALGDGDGGEDDATIESTVPNARHTIGLAVIGDSRGDGDCSAVFVVVTIINSSIRHRHCQVGRGGDRVIDTAHLKVMGICREAAQ